MPQDRVPGAEAKRGSSACGRQADKQGRLFFFCRKSGKKTFIYLISCHNSQTSALATAPTEKSFLLLFLKKEEFFFLPCTRSQTSKSDGHPIVMAAWRLRRA
jgi:hypothetical protein